MTYQEIAGGYFVRLFKGEEVITTLGKFVKTRNLGGGSISGIGAVEKVTLGYFDVDSGEYLRKEFPGKYELISLTGNIGYFGEEPVIHVHVVISDQEMVPHSGHLFSGTILVTGEFAILDSGVQFNRAKDAEIGLNLLDFPNRED